MPSARVRCDVNDFYSTLMEMVQETADEDQEALETNVKAAADNCVSILRKKKWKTGAKYSAGWGSDYRVGPEGHARAVVHNTSQPSLTHLLENGHEMFINGHDTGRRVPAYKHIEPAYERSKGILLGEGDGS